MTKCDESTFLADHSHFSENKTFERFCCYEKVKTYINEHLIVL